MTNEESYQRPASVDEAWVLLSQKGRAARLVGGGIDVMLRAHPEVTTLIDLSRLPLRYIEPKGEALAIGASTTLTELLEDSRVGAYLGGIVSGMLHRVASPLLRNMASVGGTLASANPWSDVIPVFLALDASLTVYDGSARDVTLEAWLDERRQGRDVVITEIRLPVHPLTYAAFEKFSRTAFDVGMLNCACCLTIDHGRCRSARVVIGGAPQLAARLSAVEESLIGRDLDANAIKQASQVAAESAEVRDDRRASAEYRRVLARSGVNRCLMRIAKEVQEGEE